MNLGLILLSIKMLENLECCKTAKCCHFVHNEKTHEPHRLQQTTSIPGFRLVSSNRGFRVKGENGVDRVHRFVFVEKNVPSENGPFCVVRK